MKKPTVSQAPVGTSKQTRFEALGFSAMVFAAALVLFGCIAFTFQANRILSGYDDHRRASEISATLLNIASNIHDIEAGRQGYRLTGSEQFMAPFQQGGLELRKNIGLLDSLVPEDDAEGKALVARLRGMAVRQGFAEAVPETTIDAIARDDAYRARVQSVIAELNTRFRTRQADHDAGVQTVVREAKYLFLAWVACIAGGFGLALWYGAKARRILRKESLTLSMVANHDTLTGLPNRRYLSDYLKTAIARAGRKREPLAALYIDLDGFSDINNTLGHDAGDAALVWACEAVRAEIRRSDFFARLGGDEFVIISEGTTLTQAENLAARLLQRFAAGTPLPQTARGSLGLSIGIAELQQDDAGADGLLVRADQAMYAAKRAGKRCWRVANRSEAARNDETPLPLAAAAVKRRA